MNKYYPSYKFLMDLVVENTEVFKKIFESIKDLDIVDTNFDFSEDGISIENMDVTHTSLVYLSLSRDFFKSYNCRSNMTVGLNVQVFCKILKACRENDNLRISKTKKDSFLSITISNSDKNQEFEVPEMEIECDKLSPVDNYSYDIDIESDVFSRLINDVSLVDGNHVTIQLIDANKLLWSSKGDLGKTNLEFNIKEPKQSKECSRLINTYSINFIKKFIKSSYLGLDGKITLSIDNDHPIKLTSKLKNDSEIKFYIAPQIE